MDDGGLMDYGGGMELGLGSMVYVHKHEHEYGYDIMTRAIFEK